MEFLILGPVSKVRDGGRVVALGGPQQRAVLAMLVLRANEVVSRDRLVEGLWGDHTPKSAGHIIESYVSRLRRSMGGNGLVTKAHGYALHADPGQLDLHRFETLVAEGAGTGGPRRRGSRGRVADARPRAVSRTSPRRPRLPPFRPTRGPTARGAEAVRRTEASSAAPAA